MLKSNVPRTQTLVQSKAIASASLHRPLPLKWHFYVWPFASMLYPVWIYIYFFKYDIYLGSEEWTFVTFGTILTLHALSFLVCQWSVSIKALLTCVKVRRRPWPWETLNLKGTDSYSLQETDIRKATIIKIIPYRHQGVGTLCEIHHAKVLRSCLI